MTDKEKLVEYEMQIEDMLRSIAETLEEFGDAETLTEFEQGRQEAYLEMLDIIKTRYNMILEVVLEK